MGGAPQGAMHVASQIWQVVFASQTLQVFCLAFRKKAQYVVVRRVILNKAKFLEKSIKILDPKRFMWTQIKQNNDKHVK